MKRRIGKILTLTLVFLAVLALGDAAMNKWGSGEVITGAIGHVRQQQLKHKWEAQQKKIVKQVVYKKIYVYKHPRTIYPWHFKSGDPVMRIDIPRIHLSAIVIEGTTTDDLTRGPGRIIGTGTFGETKRMAISGHRTTWSHPFRYVDKLRPGDKIKLTAFGKTLTYSVVRQFRVRPNQIGVLKGKGLILTTCDPPGSAAYRRIVQAKLTTPLT